MFLTRGGVYDWTRQRADGCAGEGLCHEWDKYVGMSVDSIEAFLLSVALLSFELDSRKNLASQCLRIALHVQNLMYDCRTNRCMSVVRCTAHLCILCRSVVRLTGELKAHFCVFPVLCFVPEWLLFFATVPDAFLRGPNRGDPFCRTDAEFGNLITPSTSTRRKQHIDGPGNQLPGFSSTFSPRLESKRSPTRFVATRPRHPLVLDVY